MQNTKVSLRKMNKRTLKTSQRYSQEDYHVLGEPTSLRLEKHTFYSGNPMSFPQRIKDRKKEIPYILMRLFPHITGQLLHSKD